MPRGGRRRGKPQTAYPNRTDLSERKIETPPTVPGQGYGVAKQQQQAQRVAPLAGTQAPTGPARPQQQQPGFSRPPPPPLESPTQKPGEPLTAGMDMGAGPGSEVLPQLAPPPNDIGLFLRELYRAQPSNEVLALIQENESKNPPAGPPPQQGPLPNQPPPTGAPPMGAPAQMPMSSGGPNAGQVPVLPPSGGAVPGSEGPGAGPPGGVPVGDRGGPPVRRPGQ